MIKKFLDELVINNNGRNSIDSSHFNDPIASQTSWKPLVPNNGSSLCTRELSKVSSERITFKTCKGVYIISLVMLLIGIAVLIFAALMFTKQTNASKWFSLIPLAGGLIALISSAHCYHTFTRPIVFDKQLGYFWKGKKGPKDVTNVDSIKIHASLNDIYAVQLIAKLADFEPKETHSYELNLITADTERINILDHAKLENIRRDAKMLADFLEKPLWDAI